MKQHHRQNGFSPAKLTPANPIIHTEPENQAYNASIVNQSLYMLQSVDPQMNTET